MQTTMTMSFRLYLDSRARRCACLRLSAGSEGCRRRRGIGRPVTSCRLVRNPLPPPKVSYKDTQRKLSMKYKLHGLDIVILLNTFVYYKQIIERCYYWSPIIYFIIYSVYVLTAVFTVIQGRINRVTKAIYDALKGPVQYRVHTYSNLSL